MNILELSEQEICRRNSLEELRRMGIDPYPAAEFPVNAYTTEIKESFNDEDEPREVCVAGRIMGRRIMGKASFAELLDSKGKIQVYITRDDICPEENKDLYNVVFKKLLDLGDFIGVKGFVFRTQTGEISIHARELFVLAKSIKPLPVVKEKDGVLSERNYRVDKLDNIWLSDIPRAGKRQFRSFNANTYVSRRMGMFSGKEQLITVRIPDTLVGPFIDQFGKKITISEDKEGMLLVTFHAVASVILLGWLLGLQSVEILEPQSVRNAMIDLIKHNIEIYSEKN